MYTAIACDISARDTAIPTTTGVAVLECAPTARSTPFQLRGAPPRSSAERPGSCAAGRSAFSAAVASPRAMPPSHRQQTAARGGCGAELLLLRLSLTASILERLLRWALHSSTFWRLSAEQQWDHVCRPSPSPRQWPRDQGANS